MRVWRDVAEVVRLYPSPHNSQPIKLRPLDDAPHPLGRPAAAHRSGTGGHGPSAALYYDLDLGLPAESFGIPFAHVCAGVFLESLRVVAAGLGYDVVERLDTRPMDFDSTERLHPLGVVTLEPRTVAPEDAEALRIFRERRTSRRPYDDRLVPEDVIAGVRAVAERGGHVFRTTADPATVRRLVRVNQATLFSDLENDAVYAEIMTWLRFSRREAAQRADGLSAEAMLMPGPLLRFAMRHRGLWRAPLVGAAIRTMYLNTMRGVRQLGWLEGPFGGPADHIEAGRTFMRVWLRLAAEGVHLHPFGTVITNPGSHRTFAEAVHADEDGDRMAWMLFRFGYSRTPPVAHRRPAAAMLVGEPA